MTRFIILATFLSYIANAQDAPKPKDDGPSLADTMKFIEEKLNSIGPVNYIVYINDGMNKTSSELANVRATVAGCRIDDHWRLTVNGQVKHEEDHWFSLKDVQEVMVTTEEQALKEDLSKAGHPEWAVRVDPPIFEIAAKRTAGESVFSLYDESLANRIAKALVHAVELCGGGSKEPF